MANHCDLCGEEIEYGSNEWKITVETYSNYNSRDRKYIFHQCCYDRGKIQIIDAVANADCLGAVIRFDKRDPEQSIDKAGARSAQMHRTAETLETMRRQSESFFGWLAFGLLVATVPFFFFHGWLFWLGMVPLALFLGAIWLWWIAHD